jgi:MoxR-like ATPase
MQERGVTVEGQTHDLARPFIVVATQNPVEFAGTYPLPEAQLDRFMVRLALGYPDRAAEAEMLADQAVGDRVLDLRPVAELEDVIAAQQAVGAVHGSDALRRYVVDLAAATRADRRTELGASPRAALMLFRASKALAALEGRDHVLPDDVQTLAAPVLAHRLLLAPGVAESERVAVISGAVESLPAL